MSVYQLRPARQEDFPAIRSMVRGANINPLGLKWERFVVIADEVGQIIACGQVKPHQDGTVELASVVVRSPWQGLGLARLVIEHLIEENPGKLYLMCRSGLDAFYRKFGFVPVSNDGMPRYFRRLSRLSGMVTFFMPGSETLLIMVRNAQPQAFSGSGC